MTEDESTLPEIAAKLGQANADLREKLSNSPTDPTQQSKQERQRTLQGQKFSPEAVPALSISSEQPKRANSKSQPQAISRSGKGGATLDAFISYSHRDQTFARQLDDALAQREFITWIDKKDVFPAGKFWEDIEAGIQEAGAFIFIISPDSLDSKDCRKELDYAHACGKKLIPVLYRAIDTSHTPQPLEGLDWIDGDPFDQMLEKLLNALLIDKEDWNQAGQLLKRAHEWHKHQQNSGTSFHLRRNDRQREGDVAKRDLASRLFRYLPFHKIWYGTNSGILLYGDELKKAENLLKKTEHWGLNGLDRRPQLFPPTSQFIRESRRVANRLFLRRVIVLFLCVSFAAGGAVGGAFAFLYHDPTLVTTLNDSGGGSLRYCIENASSGSTIRFAQGIKGTIKLKSDLVFAGGKRLTIIGPGASQLTISGAGAIIHVFKGATLNISGLSFKNSETVNDAFLFNEGTLTISSSIISGNKTTDVTSGLGGGINNSGTLTVTNRTIISNNSVSGIGINQGGGINNSGKLTLVNSIVSHNEVTGNGDGLGTGGGIENTDTGTLMVISSVISANKAVNSTNSSFGGGIENLGTLTVTNSTFSGNLVTGNPIAKGGGISNDGKLTVTQSTFMDNTANSSGTGRFDSSFGGGIENGKNGTATVTNNTFSGNLASGKQGAAGGGIGNGGKLSITESTLSKNSASGSFGFGGGIYNLEKGTLMVTSSTFSGNLASGKQGAAGGGISNTGKLSVTESTFSKNSTSGLASGIGGGILSGTKGSSAFIRFCTIYKNTSNAGGGIWVDPTGSSQIMIGDSIIAANRAPSGPDISGSVISGGYNLIENTAGATGLNASVDRQVTLADLKIDTTLGDNGGPTQTFALLQGSKAIDAVPLQACSITITDPWGHNLTITTDQRGQPRPDGSENACDVGAYESSW
jgi:TIR domain